MVATVADVDVPVGDHESEARRWVHAADLLSLGADRGLIRLAERALACLDAFREA